MIKDLTAYTKPISEIGEMFDSNEAIGISLEDSSSAAQLELRKKKSQSLAQSVEEKFAVRDLPKRNIHLLQ